MCDLMDCKDCSKYKQNETFWCEELLNLWYQLEDISYNPDEMIIEEDFIQFKAGTDIKEIWKWFANRLNVKVSDLFEYE